MYPWRKKLPTIFLKQKRAILTVELFPVANTGSNPNILLPCLKMWQESCNAFKSRLDLPQEWYLRSMFHTGKDLYRQTFQIQLTKTPTKITQWKNLCERGEELAPAYSMLSSWVIPVTLLGENQHETTHRISPPSHLLCFTGRKVEPSSLYLSKTVYNFIPQDFYITLNEKHNINICQSEYIFWNTVYEHLHLHNQLISKQTPGRLSPVFKHIIQYVELWLTLKDWTITAELLRDPG